MESNGNSSDMTTETGVFDSLSPVMILDSVERAYSLRLDGVLTAYSSYINRVYEVRDEDERSWIAKFYRPGRWTAAAVREEHQFLTDCAEFEIPVVPPVPGLDGETLHKTMPTEDGVEVLFTLFPKRAGRGFDAERDEDWLRLGSLVARVHLAGSDREAVHRLKCTPVETTAVFLRELDAGGYVHPDCLAEFESVSNRILEAIDPLFHGVIGQRIHGDCHRGNILDRVDEGLLLIDFDDMMTGPPVQDLWLLLPGYAMDSFRELSLLIEGYETFTPFDRSSLHLIEPLRFMRMIYYLTWCARQRRDARFHEAHPDWGSRAFWIKEIEDLSAQEDVIREALRTDFMV